MWFSWTSGLAVLCGSHHDVVCVSHLGDPAYEGPWLDRVA